MNKIAIALSIILLSLTGCANSQDRLDQRLFRELKAEHKLTDAQTYELLGLTYFKLDNSARASLYFKKAVALNSALYLSWYRLGLLHMDNPEHFFKKTIRANPKFAPSHYWLGTWYLNQNRNNEAKAQFDQYLNQVDRNDPIEQSRIKEAENHRGLR